MTAKITYSAKNNSKLHYDAPQTPLRNSMGSTCRKRTPCVYIYYIYMYDGQLI